MPDGETLAALAARARRQRGHGGGPRPPRLRRPGRGARVPGRRAAPHDPLLLGDMAAAVERIRAAVAAGERSACTATTTSTGSAPPPSPCSRCASSAPTSTGTCRAASRRATASRATRSRGSPTDGVGLVLTVDCGITAVEEVAEAKALGLDVIVTDHHRPGRRAARLPDRRDPAVGSTRSPSSAAPVSSHKLAAGAARCRAPGARPPPRSRRARDDRRRRAAPSTRTARSPRPGLRALARTRKPGLRALMRSRARRPGRRRCDCGRLPAGAADQRGRAARAAPTSRST